MKPKKNNICIISPFPPPFGGMAVQAEKLVMLLQENGYEVIKVHTNVDFPKTLSFLKKVPFIRTIIRQLIFLLKLNSTLPNVQCIYFLTGFENFFFWVTYPALILMLIKRKRVILSARGGGARLFFRKYGFFIKPVIKHLNAVTVPSGFLKAAFKEELNIDTTIIPNIVDLKQFLFVKRNEFCPKFIVTRSLEDIYDLPTVIKAFSFVKKRYPEAILGVVGDGSLKPILKKLVKELDIQNSVMFYGEIPHKDIYEIYNQYDIFLNASKVDNLPGAILEAFAAGLPVVSTSSGGIPYMVVHQENGLLSEIEDYESLAINAIKIIENNELGKTLAMNGYLELQKYTWSHIKSILIPILLPYE